MSEQPRLDAIIETLEVNIETGARMMNIMYLVFMTMMGATIGYIFGQAI